MSTVDNSRKVVARLLRLTLNGITPVSFGARSEPATKIRKGTGMLVAQFIRRLRTRHDHFSDSYVPLACFFFLSSGMVFPLSNKMTIGHIRVV